MRIENAILKHLIYDEDYTRKVLPFIKAEYFSDRTERLVYEQISEFVNQYNTNPTFESLIIQLNENNISEDDYKKSVEILEEIHSSKDELAKQDWLVDIKPVEKGSMVYNYLKHERLIQDLSQFLEGTYRVIKNGKTVYRTRVMISMNMSMSMNKLLGIQLRNLETDRDKRFYKIRYVGF